MYTYYGKERVMASAAVESAMAIIWEGEGRRWEDLWEYPYSDWERKAILARLEKTVSVLAAAFPEGIS